MVRDILEPQDLVDSLAVKTRLPLLWFVAKHHKTITRPEQKAFIAWRREWATQRITPDRLFGELLADPKSLMNQVYFSLYLQPCEVESREFGANYGASIDKESPGQHPTFFRMLCNLRTTMAPLARGFRKMARVPDVSIEGIPAVMAEARTHPWLVDACHFYMVYMEYRRMEWSRAMRSRYTFPSFDGKFSVNTLFVH